MNVTAVGATTSSFLTVYPDDVTRPIASNLNFVLGEPDPQPRRRPRPRERHRRLLQQAGFTHLLADVVGYYDGDKTTDAGRFVPVTPIRRIDTRPVSSPFPPPGKVERGLLAAWHVSRLDQLEPPGHGRRVGRPQRHGHRAGRRRVPHRVPARRSVAVRVEPQLRRRSDGAEPRHGQGVGRAAADHRAPPATGWLGLLQPVRRDPRHRRRLRLLHRVHPGVNGASVDASAVGDTPASSPSPEHQAPVSEWRT